MPSFPGERVTEGGKHVVEFSELRRRPAARQERRLRRQVCLDRHLRQRLHRRWRASDWPLPLDNFVGDHPRYRAGYDRQQDRTTHPDH